MLFRSCVFSTVSKRFMTKLHFRFLICDLRLSSRTKPEIITQKSKIISKDPVYSFSSSLPQLHVATWRYLRDALTAKLRAPSYFQIPADACNAENPANHQ